MRHFFVRQGRFKNNFEFLIFNEEKTINIFCNYSATD